MPPRPSSVERARQRPSIYQRQSSTLHYHTFPTAPPRNPGPQRTDSSRSVPGNGMKQNGNTPTPRQTEEATQPHHSGHSRSGSRGLDAHHHETPLPKRQLAILAVIALAEQTALNSISPYLPEMAASFPEVDEGSVGLYVGLIASAFALAQFTTNFAWGWLSDRIGRKPVVLTGTFLTACCFVAFGFSRTLWQAMLAQALMGLVNGNQGVISTCLGEITDRSNQSKAFTYLPVIYGLGGITGPIVGGLLVLRHDPIHPDRPNPYPYLLPNLFSAGVLMIDLTVTSIFLQESLEGAETLPPLGKRMGTLFAWIWQFTSSHRPTYLRRAKKLARESPHYRHSNGHPTEESSLLSHSDVSDVSDDDESDTPQLFPDAHPGEHLSTREVLNRDTVLLLLTFLIFQLSNISYNSLYPIFAQAPPPTGRDLKPEEIGISLSFAGVVTILFQVGVFGRLREKIGNRITYRASLAAFVVAFLLMPWVGYKDGSHAGNGPQTTHGKVWLWFELGLVLIVKTVAAVGGLTSALLLITNSAPSHHVLGTLNGLAQTLSAAGRAVGPFISGALFSFATHVKPKGEALAFGVFGGVAFLGFLMTLGIKGVELESEDYHEQSGDEEDGEETENDYDSEHGDVRHR
ncbi:MFS general substrate transporter [Hortaea werneckii]|nr:MFS general substrate transporter [Hortaea werneckii]KAI7356616.1 MFS general substrate transporter [Hortaea werneckii]